MSPNEAGRIMAGLVTAFNHYDGDVHFVLDNEKGLALMDGAEELAVNEYDLDM